MVVVVRLKTAAAMYNLASAMVSFKTAALKVRNLILRRKVKQLQTQNMEKMRRSTSEQSLTQLRSTQIHLLDPSILEFFARAVWATAHR